MPYLNSYNIAIKNAIDKINRDYVQHTDENGTSLAPDYRNPGVNKVNSGLFGSGSDRCVGGTASSGSATFKVATASKHYSDNLEQPIIEGGAILGLQDGTLAGDRSKPIYRMKRKDLKPISMAPTLGVPENMEAKAPEVAPSEAPQAPQAPQVGSGYTSFKDWIKPNPGPFAPIISMKEINKKMKEKELLKSKGVGSAKPRKACACGAKIKRKCTCPMEGGNGFASGTHMDTGEGPATLGIKGKGKKGGANLGIPKKGTKVKTPAKLPEENVIGTTTVVAVKSEPKKKLDKKVEKSQMPSSTLSGMGAPSRTDIVKQVMKDRGVKLAEASKIVKAEGLWKKAN